MVADWGIGTPFIEQMECVIFLIALFASRINNERRISDGCEMRNTCIC